MDFYQLRLKELKNGTTELYPGFTVGRSADLMVRGGQFYAIWDEQRGLWSTDEYDVARLVDEELFSYAKHDDNYGKMIHIKDMKSFESTSWAQFKKFISSVSDNHHQLDRRLTFANTEVKKSDYVSKRLPYSLEEGDHSAWDELVGTLYSPPERTKIEWTIGAIISGDSTKIQKFLVLYGAPGTGKGTVLNIIQKLFEGYWTTFDAKAIGAASNQFATDVFRANPLVAIQQDGDLSRIEDNARLNSIVSHEAMVMNEKFKSGYTAAVDAFLLLGTNKPVKISDAKSGLIRRLIDVHPTGLTLSTNHYLTLMSRVDFELGAIAQHCLDVYRSLGRNHYEGYRPIEMMLQTDVFFNFIEAYFDVFKAQDGASLTQAYLLFKEYCSDSGLERVMPKHKFREELRNYFDEFKERAEVDGHSVRSYYKGFNATKFKAPVKDSPAFSVVMEETESLLDDLYYEQPAQGATSHETPKKKWDHVTTQLRDLDTSELHFVQIPRDHIVVDFDLKDENGEKSLERNLEAASLFPPTYAELSKSGAGIHLHYVYDGDVETLAPLYAEGIEIKSLLGGSSLRRKLTKCNNTEVATISSGLPLKEKKMLDVKSIQSEKGMRDLIKRNLEKDIHPDTTSSVSFIKEILDQATEQGMIYDVTDMRSRIIAFANGSSNQAAACLGMVMKMKFKNEGAEAEVETPAAPIPEAVSDDRPVVFYDVEVYPNLFVVCWKYDGSQDVVRMINPGVSDIEALMKMKLVGFNNRRYDNHILYARYMGYSVEQLYKMSQKMIEEKNNNHTFGEAYGISYTDIYDFSSKKQGLKKFMIELGLPHVEMDIPWDKPVPSELVDKVVEYCVNDVRGTEATFHARKQDFVARQVLADLSGLSVNDTTQRHTARILFGTDRNPQEKFLYTDLSKEFPGYTFEPTRKPKSEYRGEDPSEGGYVYAEPGMYDNVAVLDIASMHPTTIEQLNLFGEYTPRFSALKAARLAIKAGDYDSARNMLDGKLAPYLGEKDDAIALSYALKIVINIVYGLTSAGFDNPFRDRRNRDNIVAKRGALFMIDLKHYVQEELKLAVVHIKTDSIKVANATQEQLAAITAFGEKYGYTFEHEATYAKFCLVNDAVYIARDVMKWEAVGAQFQHPVVFKTLFSKEEIVFSDYCETKQVQQGSIHLDFEHDTPMKTEKEGLKFIGKIGQFVPVIEGQSGGVIYRIKDDKHYSVNGTKGYLWLEADIAEKNGAELNMAYYQELINKAILKIGEFGDFDEFVST